MPRAPIPTAYLAVVVVRSKNRFLMVHERKHGQLWHLPAGRVEPGESLVEAAMRETLEETGIPVMIEGILRIEHTPPTLSSMARLRIIFVGRPQNNAPPKTIPDKESLRAAWFFPEEIEHLPLRRQGVKEIIHYVANGATIYPLELLTFEGAPFSR
jgi:8-oxo-dGTP pyrophosphatase MutT (NUDIX family)